MRLFSLVLLAGAIAWPAFAGGQSAYGEGPEGGSFYDREGEGWFWYERIPEPPPEEEMANEPPPPPPPAQEPPKEAEVPAVAAPAVPAETVKADPGPPAFSVAWIKANLPNYLNTAIDDPSPENIRAYYYLQRLVMDKAERFATTAQSVVMGDPILDETNRYPTATFAAQRQDDDAGDQKNELLRKLSESTGLFFFFDGNCVACGQQAYVLNTLHRQIGLKTKAISIDGTEIDRKYFPEVLVDDGQAERLGVVKTPAIVFVAPDRNLVQPISQGSLLSAKNIKERMFLVAKNEGLLSADEVDLARAVKGGAHLLDPAMEHMTEEDLRDPKKVIDILKRSIGQ